MLRDGLKTFRQIIMEDISGKCDNMDVKNNSLILDKNECLDLRINDWMIKKIIKSCS